MTFFFYFFDKQRIILNMTRARRLKPLNFFFHHNFFPFSIRPIRRRRRFAADANGTFVRTRVNSSRDKFVRLRVVVTSGRTSRPLVISRRRRRDLCRRRSSRKIEIHGKPFSGVKYCSGDETRPAYGVKHTPWRVYRTRPIRPERTRFPLDLLIYFIFFFVRSIYSFSKCLRYRLLISLSLLYRLFFR